MYFHGTTIRLEKGELLLPPNESGNLSEKGRKKNLDVVFFTTSRKYAEIYAGRAAASVGGQPVVYEVEPIGGVTILSEKKGAEVFFAPKAKIL